MSFELVALGLMFAGALCLLGAAYLDPESYEAHAEDNAALAALTFIIVAGLLLAGGFIVLLIAMFGMP